MKIRLLGTAAGGGFPQWNCACRVCRTARETPNLAKPRTQSGVAISADGARWFLLNASPDLLTQMQGFAPLQPRSEDLAGWKPALRNSPIEGVLITNADVDHTLGLSLLREGGPLAIYSTPRVREALTDGLRLLPMLKKYCGVNWHEARFETIELRDRNGESAALQMEAFDIPGHAPKYHRDPLPPTAFPQEGGGARGDSVGYMLTDLRTGGCLVFAPDVSVIEAKHEAIYARADVLLFDGTFWSEDEMDRSGTGSVRAAEMGHLPISGESGSLAFLARLKSKHRVYVHINNTNPILLEDSSERREVLARGILIGEDGMEFEV